MENVDVYMNYECIIIIVLFVCVSGYSLFLRVIKLFLLQEVLGWFK